MEQLAVWAAAFGLTLDSAQLAQFARYETMLVDWNERMALTTIRDHEAIIVRHFLDSLTCAVATGSLNDRRLADVGSGAGFPGLPLKILYPGLRLTLIESVTKKAQFLAYVTSELGLADVHIVNDRAETVGRDERHRECYDWAVARAVAELRVLAELLLPFVRIGGGMLAQKGESAADELDRAKNAIALLGGGDATLTPIRLPTVEQTHYLVSVAKAQATNERYPRRPGIPAKRPL